MKTKAVKRRKTMGQPPVVINWEVLDGILSYGASLIDCSDFMDCSEDTVQRRIKEKYNMTFSEYRMKKMSKMRLTLLQKQYEVAKMGNVSMLIWLGKQLLGQLDKQQVDTTVKTLSHLDIVNYIKTAENDVN